MRYGYYDATIQRSGEDKALSFFIGCVFVGIVVGVFIWNI